jgi:hypothetical protein
MKTWEVIGEGDNLNHVFVVDGTRKAAVWFLGGHVERPDSWNASFPPASRMKYIARSWNELDEAKESIEAEYALKSW